MVPSENYGYHGAAALNASPTLQCKKCSDERKKIFVQMEERLQDGSPVKFVCSKCGGEERIMRRLSTKHLRNMHKRALKKIQDIYTFLPLYKDLKDFYKFTINNNKDDFLRRFQGYEVLARKDLLSARTHYFIGHYDAAKRTKRRWCSITYQQLALVEINDDKYFSQYLQLIDEFVNVCIHGSVDEQKTLFESAFNKLKEIGWPEQYMATKYVLIKYMATKYVLMTR